MGRARRCSGAVWQRPWVLICAVLLAAAAITTVITGAVSTTMTLNCTASMNGCMSSSGDAAACRTAYADCASQAAPLLIAAFAMLMATVLGTVVLHLASSSSSKVNGAEEEHLSEVAVEQEYIATTASKDLAAVTTEPPSLPSAAAAAAAAAAQEVQRASSPYGPPDAAYTRDQSVSYSGASAALQQPPPAQPSSPSSSSAAAAPAVAPHAAVSLESEDPSRSWKHWDPIAVTVFTCFLASSGYYYAVRFTESLATSDHKWYPKFLLAVELLGYTAMLPYAWIMVRYTRIPPAPESRPPCPATATAAAAGGGSGGGTGVTPVPYVVHVLVPCYTEEADRFEKGGPADIPLVGGTLESILTADLPDGCLALKVYLCDDLERKVEKMMQGGNPASPEVQQHRNLRLARAQAVARLADLLQEDPRRQIKRVCRPLVYPGSEAQTNGKSANLNHALRQDIFKFRRPSDGPGFIDLVVVFDCDHRPKPHFFTRVLQVLRDSRADLLLTPQCFSNTHPGCDIFNNDNVQFWKYLLPGYDAWDYIACTGTNFCIKATALQQAGWFPDNTVTEDYALSLKLKRTKPIKKPYPNSPASASSTSEQQFQKLQQHQQQQKHLRQQQRKQQQQQQRPHVNNSHPNPALPFATGQRVDGSTLAVPLPPQQYGQQYIMPQEQYTAVQQHEEDYIATYPIIDYQQPLQELQQQQQNGENVWQKQQQRYGYEIEADARPSAPALHSTAWQPDQQPMVVGTGDGQGGDYVEPTAPPPPVQDYKLPRQQQLQQQQQRSPVHYQRWQQEQRHQGEQEEQVVGMGDEPGGYYVEPTAPPAPVHEYPLPMQQQQQEQRQRQREQSWDHAARQQQQYGEEEEEPGVKCERMRSELGRGRGGSASNLGVGRSGNQRMQQQQPVRQQEQEQGQQQLQQQQTRQRQDEPQQQRQQQQRQQERLQGQTEPQRQQRQAQQHRRHMRRFVGRYLYEHLATGLAPVEPRPWFQQRSRWTKGHMEVLLSKDCPLAFWTIKGSFLSPLYQSILCMIGTWSYITNFISTPVFFLVPFFYLVLGLEPVAFSWRLGLAASIYLPISFVMMNYVRDCRDVKAIWLAGVSNIILSFTYFKAFLNTLMVLVGAKQRGGFKSTMGTAAALAQALDPLVLGLYLLLNASTMAVAMYMLVSQLMKISSMYQLLQELSAGTVNLNVAVPFFWAMHNTVAPLLMFAYYASYNRTDKDKPPGRVYAGFVNLMWIVDILSLTAAIASVWWIVILPYQGPQKSLMTIFAEYVSARYADALAERA